MEIPRTIGCESCGRITEWPASKLYPVCQHCLHSWKPAALEAIVDANTGGETKVESDAASFGKTIVVVAIVVTAIITILAGVTAGLLTAILLVACIVGGVVYCIPTAIATNRGHPNALPILILNIAFGWTFVGWIGALIWACLAFEEKG